MVTTILRSHSHSSRILGLSMNVCVVVAGTSHHAQFGFSHRLGLRWWSLDFVGKVSAAILKYRSASWGSLGMYILVHTVSG